MPCRQRAFTLIELAAIATILAVAAAVAVPAFTRVLALTHLRTAAATLADDLSSARRAAIERGGGIAICPSRNGRECTPHGQWRLGWIVLDGATVLSAHEALPRPLTSASSDSRDRITFDRGGRSPGGNATITLCLGKRPSTAISVVNSSAGHIQTRPAESAQAAACAVSRENIR